MVVNLLIMPKVQQNEDLDMKWDKIMRYWKLSDKRWEITKTLWKEYPERMTESTKNLAEYCLRIGAIKCKHER